MRTRRVLTGDRIRIVVVLIAMLAAAVVRKNFIADCLCSELPLNFGMRLGTRTYGMHAARAGIFPQPRGRRRQLAAYGSLSFFAFVHWYASGAPYESTDPRCLTLLRTIPFCFNDRLLFSGCRCRG